MARGRNPLDFQFTSASDTEDLGRQLIRFATRSAVLVHACGGADAAAEMSYGSAVAQLAALEGVDKTLVYKRLKPPPAQDLIRAGFIEAVERYLRDFHGVDTYLSVFVSEMSRFSRKFLPSDVVELDHTWFVPLTNQGDALSKPSAIVRGWAAASWFRYHLDRGSLETMLDKVVEGEHPVALAGSYRSRLDRCIDDLLTVTSMPAGQGHLAAAALAGQFGKYAVPHIQRHLGLSPAGWRTLRAATQALLHVRSENASEFRRSTEEAVYLLLVDTHVFNYPNAYRARSFWEECAYSLPRPQDPTYRPEFDEKIIDILVERAVQRDSDRKSGKELRSQSGAPVRERQTAAVVALSRIKDWERRYGRSRWDVSSQIVEPMRRAAATPSPTADREGRGYEAGLDYAAAYVERRNNGGDLDFYVPPDDSTLARPKKARSTSSGRANQPAQGDDFWSTREEVAAIEQVLLGDEVSRILETVVTYNRAAARQLMGAAILAVNGVLRRRLIETLVTAGLGREACRVFAAVADAVHGRPRRPGEDMRFLVENAVFLISLTSSDEAIDALLPFAFPANRNEYGRATRMTALMGIGDLAHLIRSGPQFGLVREEIVNRILLHGQSTARRGTPNEPFTLPELRAALHVLTMLRADLPHVHTFLDEVERGRITYFDRDDRRTTAPDERAVQSASWCRRRIESRRRAMASEDRHAIPSWLVSPINPAFDGSL